MAESITFQDFQKLDIRIGEIVNVEDIEGADKLYKLTVNFGSEIGERTICAGVKEYISSAKLAGKKAAFIINLEPRKLKGIESQGMILAADDGKPVILCPEEPVSPGSIVR